MPLETQDDLYDTPTLVATPEEVAWLMARDGNTLIVGTAEDESLV